jgi:hypothetical protein
VGILKGEVGILKGEVGSRNEEVGIIERRAEGMEWK